MPSAALSNPLVDLPVTIVADGTEQIGYFGGGSGTISNSGLEDCEFAVSNNDSLPSCGTAGEQKVGQVTLRPNMTVQIISSWKSFAYKSANGTRLSYLPSKG